MRAQVTLIPAESKKLVAKAVARLDEVQSALKQGRVVISLGSSTIFIVEELTGKLPDTSTEAWIRGLVAPKGTCSAMKAAEWPATREGETEPRKAEFPFMWIIEKGKLIRGIPLGKLLDMMTPQDVYINGVNAVDPYGAAGLLAMDRVNGGTGGFVMARQRQVGFKLVFPAGLEKLIPISIAEAAKEAAPTTVLDYTMGRPCWLMPCEGIVVTEPRAIEILSGAKAVPISGGGLAGAEGAVTMVVSGSDEQVTKAINYIEGVKGTRLPEVKLSDCKNCIFKVCGLSGGSKHWC